MATVFHTTLRPILILSKCIGLIDNAYTLEPNGLLVRKIDSTYNIFLEIARMVVLLVFTHIYFHQLEPVFHLFQYINIIKFWNIIIAARVSTIWIIKFINSIIEFDRKFTPFRTKFSIPQYSLKGKDWYKIYISFILYFIGLKILQAYFFPMKTVNIISFVFSLFTPPYVMDYVVTIISCFFLQHLYVRFKSLNDLWKCLPPELVAVPGQWTNIEIVVLMENTRLMHTELCELLIKFTRGYGPLLLGFYTFSFISMLIGEYMIIYDRTIFRADPDNDYRIVISILVHIQIFTFMMFIIIFVSSINEKRMKMMSYLRSYQISNLHPDIKQQIKMFLQQISAYKYDQISAFGFFDINLYLVLSILVLLITGISTMIQMKDHPIILHLNNQTKLFLKKVIKNKF
ncbi:uncharacterized protein LOC132930777 [Rhopalosiphum padi]|uniref:uncharacterized protein LOC132930777 n=1 Tax=Rhopalosiphum padi TaxID=40932 RepID=UPI00298EC6D5|nr:uncharacterized protein LOC132930777 [Rhopalosiphum padi]